MQITTLFISTFSLLPTVFAHPEGGILKRAATVTWDASCNAKIDGKSSYALHPDFKDKSKRVVIEAAFADARELARLGATIAKTDIA